MHLVVGAASYAGRYAIAALGEHFPVRTVEPGDDLRPAMTGIDTVHMAANLHSPLLRQRWHPQPEPFLVDLVRAAHEAGVRRLVHLSTVQVLGPAPRAMLLESSQPRPYHAYEKLHFRDEQWLLAQRGIEVIALRAAQGFGPGEAVVMRFLQGLGEGHPFLVGGGRARRTFLAGPDLGRAFVAAALRARPGHCYLLGGFAACWRDMAEQAAAALKIPVRFVDTPYDLAYLRVAFREWRTGDLQPCWPNRYVVDLIGRSHLVEDGLSRRELSWSPMIGSFEERMGDLVDSIRPRRPETGRPTEFNPPAAEMPGSPGAEDPI
jgi:nucleoside-diphosphate-sugar epimerase